MANFIFQCFNKIISMAIGSGDKTDIQNFENICDPIYFVMIFNFLIRCHSNIQCTNIREILYIFDKLYYKNKNCLFLINNN